MSGIDNLAKRLESYLDDDQVAEIVRAYEFARDAHEGQFRKSGDPYISHPVAVASILTDMHMDHESLMAAMLHDVIEDTGISKETLAAHFGEEVAELVDGVSKITQMKFASQAEKQAENLQKMMLAMTKDIRVILVKLADRLHNMRTLHVMRPDKRRRIARETLEIYAPIAMRLGMNNMRVEFEDLGFHATYPMRAQLIGKALKQARGNRREVVGTIKQSIESRLKEEHIAARVLGREKHLYSIYSKMKEEHKSFREIMDVFGFRIIVDSVDTCYRVLGIVHNLYKPVPGKFKDYIAIPKANGYQSLHTVLIGFHGTPIEIQIRTEEMEAMANNGIAAHWLYKSDQDATTNAQSRARQWMSNLLDMQKNAGNSQEFIENVKIDLFPDEVYIFSPKGDIYELPKGATPIDFAYAVHTSVGNTCVASRVDYRLAPLSTPLESGQTVEIITAAGASPNPAWLNFAVTGKARSNIRLFLKNQRRSESIELGEKLLEKALASYNSSLSDIPVELMVSELAHGNYQDMDDLMQDIGLGNRPAPLVARRLVTSPGGEIPKSKDTGKPLVIRGTEGLVLNFAKCCYPLPGDSIFGHISAGKGLTVHRDTCTNLLNALRDNPEKCLPLHWEQDATGEFSAHIKVELMNRRGVLATLANCVAESEANIESINMVEKDGTISVVNLVLAVKNRVHLARVIKRMRNLQDVGKITRTKA